MKLEDIEQRELAACQQQSTTAPAADSTNSVAPPPPPDSAKNPSPLWCHKNNTKNVYIYWNGNTWFITLFLPLLSTIFMFNILSLKFQFNSPIGTSHLIFLASRKLFPSQLFLIILYTFMNYSSLLPIFPLQSPSYLNTFENTDQIQKFLFLVHSPIILLFTLLFSFSTRMYFPFCHLKN
jgi:hypothetical protein